MGEASTKRMKKVAADAAKDIVMPEMNKRLDAIEAYCKESLAKADKRAKDIDIYLIRQIRVDIQNQLYNAQVTLDAAIEVLAESDLKIENFANKIDAKKLEIDQRNTTKAEARMVEQMKSEQPSSPVEPQQETPPQEPTQSSESA